MDIPNHLSHKPVIKLENYADIDGIYDLRQQMQWVYQLGWLNGIITNYLLKVWRNTGTRWSRQSEGATSSRN